MPITYFTEVKSDEQIIKRVVDAVTVRVTGNKVSKMPEASGDMIVLSTDDGNIKESTFTAGGINTIIKSLSDKVNAADAEIVKTNNYNVALYSKFEHLKGEIAALKVKLSTILRDRNPVRTPVRG